MSDSDNLGSLAIPDMSGWASVVTLALSSLLYRKTPLTWTSWSSVIIYTMLIFSIGSTIILTGGLASPYLALWLAVSILAAIFDLWGVGILLALANGYLIYAFAVDGNISQNEIITALIVAEMPLIFSWILWVSNAGQNHADDPAVRNLSKQIEEESTRAATIIEAIGDGVIAVKQTGEITAINPAAQKMTGWKDTDALKLHFSSVLKIENEDGEELIDERNPVKKTLNNSQQTRSNDVRIITKAGRKIDVDFVVSPTDGSDLGEGAIAIFRDVTKERAEEREQAEFISTASHEMRTPVAAIEGYLGLALNPNTAAIDEKARDYIQKAQNSAKHLGSLFQDLLDISKAEDGKLNSSPSVIDTVSFSRDILDSFESAAKEKNLRLIFRPDGGKSTIGSTVITPVLYSHVDRGHLREILDNLIENAIKYTPSGGDISVDVAGESNDSVRFLIKDSGLGIPEEDLSHLFQKFYRVDSSQTREIGGTGLGLYLCRRLVESMHGRIWVESTTGAGSTFFVEIPRIDHQQAGMLLERAKVEIPQTPVPMPTLPPELSLTEPSSSQPSNPNPNPNPIQTQASVSPGQTTTPIQQAEQIKTADQGHMQAQAQGQVQPPTQPAQQQTQQPIQSNYPTPTTHIPLATPTPMAPAPIQTTQPQPLQNTAPQAPPLQTIQQLNSPINPRSQQPPQPPQSPQPIKLTNMGDLSSASAPTSPIQRQSTNMPPQPQQSSNHPPRVSVQQTSPQVNQQTQQPTQQQAHATVASRQGTRAYMDHSNLKRANVPLSELERDPQRYISPR